MKAAAGKTTPGQWLETAFDVWGRILDPDSQNIGPIIAFKSLTDPGEPMNVRLADYADTERWRL